MNTNSGLLQIGSIKAAVFRKPIKNLHLSVLPPDGKVRVSAPLHLTDDVLKMFLASKISWINKQKNKFALQERQTNREFVSGEDCYFLGKRYRLDVMYKDQMPKISIRGRRIILQVKPYSDIKKREKVLLKWYREQLKIIAERLFKKWQKKIGVAPSSWHIRRMKTRWGTCNHRAKRIWINLELAKKPEHCLDFIIMHETTHLLERKHNDRFKAYMDRFLPRWRQYKEELNRTILSHENWHY